jgi:hypothetical protein
MDLAFVVGPRLYSSRAFRTLSEDEKPFGVDSFFFQVGMRSASSLLPYRSVLRGGRHEENLSHLDRPTARFSSLARPL